MSNLGRVIIDIDDMPGGMRNDAVNISLRAIDIFGSNQLVKVAGYIAEEFNRMYEYPWQCFVGDGSFPASYIFKNYNHRIKLKIDNRYYIYLFRTRNLSK